MAMDSYLAELYSTGQVEESGAEDQLIEKIAADLEEEGIDIDELEDSEVEELAEVYGEEADGEGEAAEEGAEKTAEAKFEEADYMGRIMAHSYAQELTGIQKEAAKKSKKVGLLTKKYRQAKGAVRRTRKGVSELLTRGRSSKELRKAKKILGKGRVLRRGVLPALGGAAALGAGAGYMAKKSSALGGIVEQRALEMLEEAGYDVE